MTPGLFDADRWQFVPFWKVSRLGFISDHFFALGCDEFHNRSRYVVIPLVGLIVFFWEPTLYPRDTGDEHLYGTTSNFTEGRLVKDCVICAEILLDTVIQDVPHRDDPVFTGPSTWIIRRLQADGRIDS